MARIKVSTIYRCMQLLPKKDRIKLILVGLVQILLSVLDLIGVMLLGVIGTLTVAGIGSRAPGDRVQKFLNLIHLEELSLQATVGILGFSATIFLICKTFFALYFSRKILFFLSRKSAELSGTLVSRLLNQSLVKVQENSLQKNMYALTNGVGVVVVQILGATISIISDIALLVLLSASLFIADWSVAVMSIFLFALVATILYKLMNVEAQKLGIEQSTNSIKSQEKISEIIFGFRELYIRDSRNLAASSIEEVRLALSNSSAKLSFMQNISRYVLEITVVIGTMIIAAVQFVNNSASHAVAVLSIFMAASSRIAPAVLRLQQSLVQLRGSYGTAGPTLEMVRNLQEISPLIKNSFSSKNYFDHSGFTASVSLQEVSLTYPGKDKPALSGINLHVEAGKFIAIVGPSGAGKTSLVDVILGVTKPNSGSCKLSELNPEEAIQKWPGAVGYVPQDVVLTNGSIQSNLSIGIEQSYITEEAIWNALSIAQLDAFVSGLPNKLKEKIGDRGAKISGGQRQRLGIARAIYTNPRILILDEATSALDGETESVIANSLQSLKGKTTLIVVAHRLATVREADLVIYMEEGKIICAGKFDDVRRSIANFDLQARLMGL